MDIALVDSTPNPGYYPLPLLKIGAWRRDIGDECELFLNRLPEAGAFDQIWISTVFTFHIPHAMGMVEAALERADRVVVGGVSATLLPRYFRQYDCEVHLGAIPEAEEYHPDHSLLHTPPKYSIASTSVGCTRKCKFCMVRKLQPNFEDRPDWPDDIYRGAEKLVFYDNNWLAKPTELLERDAEIMHRLFDFRRITEMDFSQGLDCRLMTEEKADLLEGLPIVPIRFAFDHMGQDGYYQDAVRMMAERGFGIFRTYVLFNFHDTPQDFYYRLKESVRLTIELDVPAVDSFPMCYRPILKADPGHEYVGPHWTLRQVRGFSALKSAHSGASGTVSTHSRENVTPMEEFEYWFGKTPDEFAKLISYPRITELAKAKKGKMRLMRARQEVTV